MEAVAPFPNLPEELVKFIFELACLQPHRLREQQDKGQRRYRSRRQAEAQRSQLDVETAIGLMCVSRATYNLIAPILYRSVTLARPTQLLAFARGLLERPSLGTLIRNLWVGSLDGIPRFPAVSESASLFAAAAHHRLQGGGGGGGDDNDDAEAAKWVPDGSMLAYFDDGADFASMYVSGDPQHASGLRRAGGLAGTPEFGVERRSAGYDASGSWIGIDEWMLRCVELQSVVEFHYEWIRLASHLHAVGTGLEKEDEEKAQRDQEAMRDDPLDWDEAGAAAPTPLPSQQPQAAHAHHHGGTISASSSSAEWMNMANSMTLSEAESFPQVLGFSHITDFFTLRSAGLSPREAARPLLATLIEELAGSKSGLTPESATRVDLLAGDGETDHFGHPALFARSGAVDLVFGLGAAAGDNAPPNAIPAAAAALAAFGQAMYEDDEDDDDEDDDEDHRGEADGGPREAREEGGRGRRGASSRATLDVADLFGHVSYDARTLYKNESTREGGPSNGDAHPRRKLREAAMAQATAQKAVSPLRPSLPTLGSLLANMRSVLAMCPRIRLLGLNGFLERAVGGERETVGLSELRHLSLGPPPLFWSSALRLNQGTFSHLRSIHISGCMLFRSEARALGGYDGQLPRLREVAWTLWLAHLEEHPVNVVEALCHLLGAVRDPDGGGGPTRRRRLRSVTATLNPEDVRRFLANRTVPDSLKDDDRLVLVECPSQDQDMNVASVRHWWERKAGFHSPSPPLPEE